MINFILNICFLVFGFFLGRFKDKISLFIKQVIFLIKNYKAIKKSKYYNEFYEDYISSQDFERGDLIG